MKLKVVLTVAWALFAAQLAQSQITDWSEIVMEQYGHGENEPTVRLELPPQLGRGTLPHFSLRDRNGDARIQARHIERMVGTETKRIALIFFATWCVPCAQGAIRLQNASVELRRNGILPIFINIGERDVAAVNDWVDQYAGQGFARFIDVRSAMAESFGLLGSNGQMVTPKTLVLDRNLRPLFLLGEEGKDYPEVLWR